MHEVFQKEDKGKKRNEMSLLCNAYRKNLDYHNRLEVDDTMTPKVERKKTWHYSNKVKVVT